MGREEVGELVFLGCLYGFWLGVEIDRYIERSNVRGKWYVKYRYYRIY